MQTVDLSAQVVGAVDEERLVPFVGRRAASRTTTVHMAAHTQCEAPLEQRLLEESSIGVAIDGEDAGRLKVAADLSKLASSCPLSAPAASLTTHWRSVSEAAHVERLACAD